LGGYNGSNVVPASIKAHVAGNASVLVDAGHNIVNAITIRACLFDRIDQHLSCVIPVTAVVAALVLGPA